METYKDILARFMGFTIDKSGYSKTTKYGQNLENYSSYTTTQVLYDTSFDWIMPVVEKIEELGYISTIEKLSIGSEHRVWFNEKMSLIEVANGARDDSKLTAIFLACVNFVLWYKKNNKEYSYGVR